MLSVVDLHCMLSNNGSNANNKHSSPTEVPPLNVYLCTEKGIPVVFSYTSLCTTLVMFLGNMSFRVLGLHQLCLTSHSFNLHHYIISSKYHGFEQVLSTAFFASKCCCDFLFVAACLIDSTHHSHISCLCL